MLNGTGSLVNGMMAGSASKKPEVGMGATMLGWTDRHAATVRKVNEAGTKVWISQDKATRVDNNGRSESQEYTFETVGTVDDAVLLLYTLRQNGKWVRVTESMKGGTKILIGHREEYYDYSF